MILIGYLRRLRAIGIYGCCVAAGLLAVMVHPQTAAAARLFLGPETGTYSVGSTFTVAAYVDTQDDTINALSGTLTYPATQLRVISVSRANSIINVWVQEPQYSNAEARVHFEGVVLNPGFRGGSGRMVSVVFRVLAPGQATVSYTNGSALANDGQGTNILEGTGEAQYTLTNEQVVPVPSFEPVATRVPEIPIVRSTTHPDEAAWSSAREFVANWDLPSDVTALGTAFDTKPTTVPQQATLARATAQIDLAPYTTDGTYYFHLRFKNSRGWGPTLHRAVRIDRTSPEITSFTIVPTNDPTTPQPEIELAAHDTLSTIARYEYRIGTGSWVITAPLGGRFTLPVQPPQSTTLSVRVTDAAGNAAEQSTYLTISPLELPTITQYPESIRPLGCGYLAKIGRVLRGNTDEFRAITKCVEASYDQYSVVIAGTAPKNNNVRLELRGKSDLPVRVVTVPVNEMGRWSGTYTHELLPGRWELVAQTIDQRGAQSLYTQPVSIRVYGTTAYYARIIVQWGVVVALALIMITLLFGLSYLIIYGFILIHLLIVNRFKRLREKVTREITES